MGKYSPGHYSSGVDAGVADATGQSIVLTARGPDGQYIDAKYSDLADNAMDGFESIRTNIKDEYDLDAALESLENAINAAPGYESSCENVDTR